MAFVMRNVMSVDLEDWFCVYNLNSVHRFEDWPKLESRVESNTLRLLDLFAKRNVVLTDMTKDEFDADLEVTGRVVSQPVKGFRALSFSVTQKTMWAVETLERRGIRYGSSVFPIGLHPDYGIGDAPRAPYAMANGLFEVPMNCAVLASRRIPCSGGGYFRLLPSLVTRRLMRRRYDGRF